MSQMPKKVNAAKKSKQAKSKDASRMQKTVQPSAMSKITTVSTASGPKTPNVENGDKSRRKKTKKPSRTKEGTKEESIKPKMALFDSAGGKKYRVVGHFRNPHKHAEFFTKDDNGVVHMLRLEPNNRAKLKFMSEILTETIKAAEDEKPPLVQSIEYGTSTTLECNYLILSAYGIQIGEVLKIVKTFTPGCALNVSIQCLDAIRYMHQAGYVNRNIKPATFSIGFGDKETIVMMTDFRLARTHFETGTKKVRKARQTVPYCGTARYVSLAGLRGKEQGRRDDLESWMYMLYDLLDPVNGLSWRTMTRTHLSMLIKEKENFKNHVNPLTYKVVPEELKKLVDLIHGLKYESAPDYGAIKEILESTAKAKNYDLTACDWAGKVTPEAQAKAVAEALDKSDGNVCSGADDFEHGKKKPSRKIMNPDDTIKNGPFTWKVVNLLGSGGFGDVYKVYEEKNKSKCYALKTESEEGKKVMLRLKVEMQVLMAIQDARKADPKCLRHFVEFVDRGKSDDLKCKFIVMSLVGPSLDDCRKKYNVCLNSKQTPYIIAIQSLEAVRDLHALGYLHRDIKPANFAVGFGPDEPTVFMLDFGIGRSYLDPKTKEHRAPRKSVKFLGTLRYASRACMKGIDQGRKDDLECWLFMVFDIFDEDSLSWRKEPDRSQITHYKDNFFNNKLPSMYDSVPHGMKYIVSYVGKLQFQSTPEYGNLIVQLTNLAETSRFPINNMNGGGWVGKLKQKMKTERFKDSDSESDRVSGSADDD
ncbi:unnamed protein product [Caenorhabditis sp. 36 PRJEB53466]|nr:unnamed protein product [Caenorhabditis sp. 36 PRJEB53466]